MIRWQFNKRRMNVDINVKLQMDLMGIYKSFSSKSDIGLRIYLWNKEFGDLEGFIK